MRGIHDEDITYMVRKLNDEGEDIMRRLHDEWIA